VGKVEIQKLKCGLKVIGNFLQHLILILVDEGGTEHLFIRNEE
jgi:hypothetical protein